MLHQIEQFVFDRALLAFGDRDFVQKRGVLLIGFDGGLVVVEPREPDIDSRDVLVQSPPCQDVFLDSGLGGVHLRLRSGHAGDDGLFGGRHLAEALLGRVGSRIKVL